jgi:hypothetical protein
MKVHECDQTHAVPVKVTSEYKCATTPNHFRNWRPWHDFSDANSVAAQDISELSGDTFTVEEPMKRPHIPGTISPVPSPHLVDRWYSVHLRHQSPCCPSSPTNPHHSQSCISRSQTRRHLHSSECSSENSSSLGGSILYPCSTAPLSQTSLQ